MVTAQYSWDGSLPFVPFTNFNSQSNLMQLATQGMQSFVQNVSNINQITPAFVNSLVDNSGIGQTLIYPPQGANGNRIPMDVWNSN